MSIIIHGKNTSDNNDAEYLFQPTNQQINNLNTLCYGRMDTPIKSVQFNFNGDQNNLLQGCYIELILYNLNKYGDIKFSVTEAYTDRIEFNRTFNNISQFYDYIQKASKRITIRQNLTFEQGLTFSQDLLEKGHCSFCFYAQCIESANPEWPVDRVNMDTEFVMPYTTDYLKVMTLYGENLLRMLGMQYVQEDFKKYMLPYYDTLKNKKISPLIRVTYEDGTTSVQDGVQDNKKVVQYDFYIYTSRINQNLLCMCPTWWIYNKQSKYVTEKEITRQDVTYTVPTHYDWNNCFYTGGLKYNPSQWINRQTNQPINVYSQYKNELDKFYFYSSETYSFKFYDYLFFDSPQLAFSNYTGSNGKTYNIISKTVNNTNPNQYFTMTTTEPLKRLTLQNLADLKIHLTVYNESFNIVKAYHHPLLIITMDRQKQEEQELREQRKIVYGSDINVYTM